MTLEDFPHQITIPVQWGEMDALGHVNNASYVRWGESARISYFDQSGLFDRTLHSSVLGFQSLKYIAPVVYPDTVRIGTQMEEIRHDRFIMRSHFFSEALERLVVIHLHEIVVLDAQTFKRLEIPQSLRDAVAAFEAK